MEFITDYSMYVCRLMMTIE